MGNISLVKQNEQYSLTFSPLTHSWERKTKLPSPFDKHAKYIVSTFLQSKGYDLASICALVYDNCNFGFVFLFFDLVVYEKSVNDGKHLVLVMLSTKVLRVNCTFPPLTIGSSQFPLLSIKSSDVPPYILKICKSPPTV